MTSRTLYVSLALTVSLLGIYQKAWEVTRKHKSLWVFALALSLSSGGSSYLRSLRSINPSQISPTSQQTEPAKNLLEPAVKGVQATRSLTEASSSFGKMLHQTPVGVWVALALAVMAVGALSLLIMTVTFNWARASLIAGIENAQTSGRVWFTESSQGGLGKVKALITLTIYQILIVCGGLLLFAGAYALIMILGRASTSTLGSARVVAIAIGIGGLIITVALEIAVSLAGVWAQRLVVLEDKTPGEALRQGWRLAKKNFRKMARLAFGNCLVGGVVTVLTGIGLGISFMLAMGALASKASAIVKVAVALPAGALFLAGILGAGLAGAIMLTFKFSTWNILFKEIINKDGDNS